MLKIPDKYLWDGKENMSDNFLIRRMIEYASFSDLIMLPTLQVYNFISNFNISRLRCDEKRKIYLIRILPFLKDTDDWQQATLKMIKHSTHS